MISYYDHATGQVAETTGVSEPRAAALLVVLGVAIVARRRRHIRAALREAAG
ncbi:MAG TPA: MYXO-CTERM sorting domain-containing protein [Thermoguttaceae bacterium]|nr:MYXO-CTERM sorting domain-containing protein [Thermoguttaceae bacterium]